LKMCTVRSDVTTFLSEKDFLLKENWMQKRLLFLSLMTALIKMIRVSLSESKITIQFRYLPVVFTNFKLVFNTKMGFSHNPNNPRNLRYKEWFLVLEKFYDENKLS
jgi:hypothetical protein